MCITSTINYGRRLVPLAFSIIYYPFYVVRKIAEKEINAFNV